MTNQYGLRAAVWLLATLALAVPVYSERFFFAHPGDNPLTPWPEYPGQEIDGLLHIPPPGNTFTVSIWFENGPYWRGNYIGFFPLIGFDRATTSGRAAMALDGMIGTTSNMASQIFQQTGKYSRFPGPGESNFLRLGYLWERMGLSNPKLGTNNPTGPGSPVRPYGVRAMFAAFSPMLPIVTAAMNPYERVCIGEMRLMNFNLERGDIYGDTPNEMGLILYAPGTTNGRVEGGWASYLIGGQIRPAGGDRIAVGVPPDAGL